MRAAGGADELSLKGQASMDRSLPFTGVLGDVGLCGTCTIDVSFAWEVGYTAETTGNGSR